MWGSLEASLGAELPVRITPQAHLGLLLLAGPSGWVQGCWLLAPRGCILSSLEGPSCPIRIHQHVLHPKSQAA